MINCIFKNLNYNFKLEYGINSIFIENIKYFRDIYSSFSDYINLLKGLEELNKNNTLFINNLLDLDLNEKKQITDLHKYLVKYLSHNLDDEKIAIINKINDLFSHLLVDTSLDLDYDLELDWSKIFQSIDLKYRIDEKFLDNVLSFINNQVNNTIKVIIIYNLSLILTEEEVSILNEELKLKQIIVLDISPLKTIKTNTRNNLIIDRDYIII